MSEELEGETKGKVQQTGEQAFSKVKEVGRQVSDKTRTTVKQVRERPESIAEPGRAEEVASKSGKIIGAGLKKAANVITGFASGFQRGIKSGKEPKEEEQTMVTEEETS